MNNSQQIIYLFILFYLLFRARFVHIQVVIFSDVFIIHCIISLGNFCSEDCLLEVYCKHSLFKICAVHLRNVSPSIFSFACLLIG